MALEMENDLDKNFYMRYSALYRKQIMLSYVIHKIGLYIYVDVDQSGCFV